MSPRKITSHFVARAIPPPNAKVSALKSASLKTALEIIPPPLHRHPMNEKKKYRLIALNLTAVHIERGREPPREDQAVRMSETYK